MQMATYEVVVSRSAGVLMSAAMKEMILVIRREQLSGGMSYHHRSEDFFSVPFVASYPDITGVDPNPMPGAYPESVLNNWRVERVVVQDESLVDFGGLKRRFTKGFVLLRKGDGRSKRWQVNVTEKIFLNGEASVEETQIVDPTEVAALIDAAADADHAA
jgi:hypothetical protein